VSVAARIRWRYMSELPNSHELDKQILVETVGSVLWFLMDGLWMLNQPTYAKAMVAPTLAVNLFVFRYTRRSFSQISVVAAMNAWLLMNVFWMVGDFDKDARLLELARAMFGFGMLLLALAIGRAATDSERLMKVLARFRRLRA
jgi:hypothetical protein